MKRRPDFHLRISVEFHTDLPPEWFVVTTDDTPGVGKELLTVGQGLGPFDIAMLMADVEAVLAALDQE